MTLLVLAVIRKCNISNRQDVFFNSKLMLALPYSSSGSDQCVSSNPSPKCSLEANFFAGVSGSTGSVCDASVSSYITGVPNGCGCYPNVSAPCTYDPSLKNAALSCFECTSKDLAAGQCPGCKACLDGHHPCIDTDPTNEVHIESCLSSMDGAHRQNCHEMCNKY